MSCCQHEGFLICIVCDDHLVWALNVLYFLGFGWAVYVTVLEVIATSTLSMKIFFALLKKKIHIIIAYRYPKVSLMAENYFQLPTEKVNLRNMD